MNSSPIYVDYNGTTPLAPEVVDSAALSLKEDWGNPSTLHALGRQARMAIEDAREKVASMIEAFPNEITFTSGGTETNNMVILGLCDLGDKTQPCHVITSNVEHDSIANPLKYLQNKQNLQVTEINVSEYDSIVDNVIAAILENTVLITIMAANNETGVLFPLREIGERLQEVNGERKKKTLSPVIFHSDAAQILGKEPVSVKELNLDCLTIVGHKFYGPRIGALWSRISVPPLIFGGGCQKRPGTENTPMIVGLGRAAALVSENLGIYRKAMETARRHLELKLQSLPVAVTVNCASVPRLVNTCNASFKVPEPYSGRDILDRCTRVLAGVGAACHSHLNRPLTGSRILLNSGVASDDARTAIRLSLGRDATVPMIDDIFVDLNQAILSLLKES